METIIRKFSRFFQKRFISVIKILCKGLHNACLAKWFLDGGDEKL